MRALRRLRNREIRMMEELLLWAIVIEILVLIFLVGSELDTIINILRDIAARVK